MSTGRKISTKKYDPEVLFRFLDTMLKIRAFESTVEEKFLGGEIPGFLHIYLGQEAIATGVMTNLRKTDYIQSTHRGHGHTLAKGADVKKMMAEIFGKRDGCCKGKGGSMHIADFGVGMLGANGIVGGGFTLATGAALAIQMQKKDDISVVFFGDGASNRGTFHEAANMAAIWKLPVLFVCENNQFASTTPVSSSTSVENISDRAKGYNMPGVIVDGNDVFSVYDVTKDIIKDMRKGLGPALIEAKTLRAKGHFVGDPEAYRDKIKAKETASRCDPIKLFKERVLADGSMTLEEIRKLEIDANMAISEALEFARKSPEPEPMALYEDVYA